MRRLCIGYANSCQDLNSFKDVALPHDLFFLDSPLNSPFFVCHASIVLVSAFLDSANHGAGIRENYSRTEILMNMTGCLESTTQCRFPELGKEFQHSSKLFNILPLLRFSVKYSFPETGSRRYLHG